MMKQRKGLTIHDSQIVRDKETASQATVGPGKANHQTPLRQSRH